MSPYNSFTYGHQNHETSSKNGQPNHEINDLVQATIKKQRAENYKDGVMPVAQDMSTKLDEAYKTTQEAKALTKALGDRILETNKGDYAQTGHYPKFYDLSNKIAALHAWHENVLNNLMTPAEASEIDGTIGEVQNSLSQSTDDSEMNSDGNSPSPPAWQLG